MNFIAEHGAKAVTLPKQPEATAQGLRFQPLTAATHGILYCAIPFGGIEAAAKGKVFTHRNIDAAAVFLQAEVAEIRFQVAFDLLRMRTFGGNADRARGDPLTKQGRLRSLQTPRFVPGRRDCYRPSRDPPAEYHR